MNRLDSLLAELIQINSVNSFYGGPGEGELANWIESYFRRLGLETWRQMVFDAEGSSAARENIIAKLPGKDPTRRIILEAHMDTVSAQGMEISPFDPIVRDGCMLGRGSCDTKAGLAAMMFAVEDLHRSKRVPPCEVWLAAVVDEEYSFRGVLKLCEGLKASAAIVAEPTELRLAIASKGVLRWRMVARGRAAHSSKTHLGVNAIYHMAKVVLALEKHHQQLSEVSHPLLGTASCNVGIIEGGVQVNFVPDLCSIEIDRRLLPGEDIDGVLRSYEMLLKELSKTIPSFDVVMDPPRLIDQAWMTDPTEPIVGVAVESLKSLGMNAEVCGVPFGSDASKLGRAGIPTLLFGPGSIDQAHSAVEYVDLDQLEQAFQFYRSFLIGFE